jgi:glucosamine 6-phosphate synthetase-like amidotransferase/phosphosugar isomerase protein
LPNHPKPNLKELPSRQKNNFCLDKKFKTPPKAGFFVAALSGAMEMKARGGFIIGISFKSHEVFDYYLPVSDCGDASNIPNVVIAQLLGYYLALKKGFHPDKPRNLAKSVTVK